LASDVHITLRNHALEPERKVTLSKEGVIRVVGPKGEMRIPVHEIGLVELGAEASISHDVAFICQIYRKRAWFPVLTLKSKRYRGPNDFAGQDTDYRAFVAALHGQIVKNAWPVKTQVAARPSALMHGFWSYGHWALLIWIAVFLGAVLGLAALDPPWAKAIPDVAFALASLTAAAFAAWRIYHLRATYGPWPYAAAHIPDAVLPQPLSPL
jgi:hypothetical protein